MVDHNLNFNLFPEDVIDVLLRGCIISNKIFPEDSTLIENMVLGCEEINESLTQRLEDFSLNSKLLALSLSQCSYDQQNKAISQI